ncbi:polysaccharide deacetylase family protein [Fusibacter bizertensis]|uniref:Polysaccharide deacetylase family protein n=1 Tax=Fusibacter bizertensis TaxID=1488331 RepID=A0ABT6NC45_9FIRM|nr:polysaccharide deacetylase family protein [Fusibacter bizertensis]MDH8677984.1 polysaccharide deacetylase family protein [Fusibacter bizertensis]
MNKKISIIFMLMVVLTIISSCSTTFEEVDTPIRPEASPSKNDDKNPEIGVQSVIEEEDYQIIAVHFPVTGYNKVDNALNAFASNRIELFKQETADTYLSNEENWPFELQIEYEIVYETSRHLSLLFKETKYLGGAQSLSTIYTFNFNLEQGRELALKDLFKGSSAYLEILSQFVFDQLINENALNIALDEDWVVKGSSPLESNFKHFLFTNDGIIILFEKYQIGPAFIGEPRLEIPFDVFTAHIELKETIEDIETNTTDPSNLESTTEEYAISPVTTEANQAQETTSSEEDDITVVVGRKKIAITFEDGPDPVYTPLILDTLKSRSKVATFFLLGIRVNDNMEISKRIYDEGHLIGNHSWSHPQLTRLSNEDLIIQMDKTQNIISQATGYFPFLYRPSYGIYNENVISNIQMPAILWSIDPNDLKYKDSAYLTNYILDHAFDGAIIVLHDTNASTTQALSAILDGLTADGYDIVTVDELLNLRRENQSDNVRIYSQALEN